MQNRKKRNSDSAKKEESSGLQTGLLALGAAALGAVAGAAIYHGVRYFFDDSSNTTASATDVCSGTSKQNSDSDKGNTDLSARECQRGDSILSAANTKTNAKIPEVNSLNSKLLVYSLSYISVAECDVSLARKSVNKVCTFIEAELRKRMVLFHWGQINEHVFMSDLFLVRYPSDFYVTVPCLLPSSCWTLTHGLSGNYEVTIKENLLDLPTKLQYNDFLQKNKLSAQKLINAVFETLKAVELGCSISYKPGQGIIEIIVEQSSIRTPVKINMCLSVQLDEEDVVLVADEGEWFPWRWRAIEDKFNAMGGSESCGTTVVRLMRAIQLNHPQYLAEVDVMVWCSLVLQVADYEDEWAVHHLPERLVDVLKTFEHYIHHHNLPDYFNPRRNLLASLTTENITQLSEYLTEIIGTGTVERLLLSTY